MKKFVKSLLLVLVVAITAGCARKVVVSEVLQMQIDDKLFTKYNIWYTNPQEISCLNIQQGSILPIGTEVEIVQCNEKSVTFIDVANKQSYTIKFDRGVRLCNMQEFIQMTFTTQTVDELLANIAPETVEKIKNATVVKGMRKKEVEFAYGPVPAMFTPDKRNITWMYPIEENRYIRLIFRSDKLRNILNLYENAK